MLLTTTLTLRETLNALEAAQQPRKSRYIWRSFCYFIKPLDIAVHIVFPELLEDWMPKLARYLRSTSPRWGRSWRDW